MPLKLPYLYSSMICTENNSSSHQIQEINVNKAFSGCILAFSKDKGQIWIDVLEQYRPIGHNTALAVNYFFGGFGQHMDDFGTGTRPTFWQVLFFSFFSFFSSVRI